MYLWQIGGLMRRHSERVNGPENKPKKSTRDFRAERIKWMQEGADPSKMPMPDEPEPDAVVAELLARTAIM